MPELTIEEVIKTPCLIIEWKFLGLDQEMEALSEEMSVKMGMTFNGKTYLWKCEYYLNLPLRETDCRYRKKNGFRHKATLGGTKVSSSRSSMIYEDGTINTPFRDGAHIQWDAELLKLPMYVISEGKVMPFPVPETKEA
jgi:hypothetical protein